MNVFDCIFNRRSVRAFKREPVDDRLIGVMLHAATHAPSAGNTQEWHFVVVKDEEVKRRLAEAAFHQSFIQQAPVVIVVCIDMEKINLRYGKRGELLYAAQDTANAAMLILLAAHALGLSSCWVGSFDEDRAAHAVELPEKFRPVVILPIGYAAEQPEKPSRVPFESLTSVDRYGKKYDIAYAVQPEPGKEVKLKPIGNIIEDAFKKYKQKRGKLTFSEFLKRLASVK